MSRRKTSTVEAAVRRCAIYTRKSTSMGLEQEFNSLHAQREACLAYIDRQPGWLLVPDSYDDGGFTGANTDRPAFQRLLADVEARRVDIIVVYKVDRLSRSLLDFAKVMERLSAADTSFVSVTQNFSTADAMGRLTLNMLMSFAEFEREMIAERTRDKIAASRRKGKWTGGPVPFGYDVKDKKLAVNEGEASIVREAFRLFLQHERVALTAREMTERGLLPRRVSWSRPDKVLAWTKDSLARLLDNPLYAGFITCGDDLIDGEHAALIERDTWERSQHALRSRARGPNVHGVNPDYVLRGLLRCGRCGAAMCAASTKKSATVHRYYRCMERDKHGRGRCGAPPLAALAIERYVARHVSEWVAAGGLAEESLAALKNLVDERRALFEAQRHHLAERLGEASARSGKLADEWVNAEGQLKMVLGQRLEAANAETVQLQTAHANTSKQLEVLVTRKYNLDWVTRALTNFSTVWDMMNSVNKGRLLSALLEKVVVDEACGSVDIHFADLSVGLPQPTETEAA